MATAPTVPNFEQYNFVLGDDDEAISKQNGQNAALVNYGNALKGFGEAIEQEQAAAIQAVETIRDDDVIPAKDTAVQAATDAGEARDKAQEWAESPDEVEPGQRSAKYWAGQAEQTVTGDTAITSLQPGTGSPGEIVTPDGQGGLVYSTQLKRYDLASAATTDTLDLAQQQVFRVDASSARTLAFANEPGADRAMTVVVHVTGNSAVTWPAGIDWDSDAAPELGDNVTKVVLFWDGVEWSGFVRVAK